MGNSKVPDLVNLLKTTLANFEAHEDFNADDPAAIEFRRNILRIIADLEATRSQSGLAECA